MLGIPSVHHFVKSPEDPVGELGCEEEEENKRPCCGLGLCRNHGISGLRRLRGLHGFRDLCGQSGFIASLGQAVRATEPMLAENF